MKTQKNSILFAIALLAVMALVGSAQAVVVEEPDLNVTSISVNCNELFGNESNEICAEITNIGVAAAAAFNVSFVVDGYREEVRVSGLAASASITECINDSTLRNAGTPVTITVTADCNAEVPESDETNNASSIAKTVVNNGYKGKRYTGGDDLETLQTHTLNGNLLYSLGDSYYLSSSSYPHWTTYNASWTASNLTVSGTATIEKARLYVIYTWEKKNVMPDNVSMTFNGIAQTMDKHYTDQKSFGSWDRPYGMLAYDVTGDFNTGGNAANLTNSYAPGGGNVSMRGMALVVVYADSSEPSRIIYINEGYDLLYAGSSKCTTSEEATAYAPFTGPAIDLSRVENATLITFAPGASPDEGELLFNGQTWYDVWSYVGTTGPIPQVAIDERDVTAYLQSTGNEAAFQSSSDYMEGSNAFLVVELSTPPTPKATVYFEPANVSANYDDETTVSVWANTSEATLGGRVVLDYTCCCANITDWLRDTTNFPIGAADIYCGYASLTFTSMTSIGPGLVHIGDLTIHCCNDTSDCETDLAFVTTGEGLKCELTGADFANIEPVEWQDGTINCTAPVTQPDLNVTSITVNPEVSSSYQYIYANESNNISAEITNIGVAAAAAFNVSFVVDGYREEVRVSGLAAGASITECITDPTLRNAGANVTITVTADCNGEVGESDETNNASSITETVVNCGYKGKRYTGGEDLETVQTHTLKGNLIYSFGDSYYMSGYSGWTTYNVSWNASDLPVPGTATIEKARLYVIYTWDRNDAISNNNVSVTFNGIAQPLDMHYTDRKMFGSYNYPYGMLAYDVIGDFNTGGNVANLTNSQTGQTVSMRGMALVVVYADSSEPSRIIYINEGYDILYGGSAKCTTPEEATAYAPFTGPAIDLSRVENATLITFAPGAGPDEADLLFNGQTWYDVWNFVGDTQVGVDERNVTAYLQSTGNEARFQSSSDWMEAANAFLVVELSTPPTPEATVYFEPATISANYDDETTVSVWANTSEATLGGRVVLDYTCCCANITDWVRDTTNFPIGAADIYCGYASLTFTSMTSIGPGLVHIGDLTIHCCDNTSDCETNLAFVTAGAGLTCELTGGDFTNIEPVEWLNGTINCTAPVEEPDLNVTEKYETLDDGNFTVTYTVANIGGAEAGASNTTIYVDGTPVMEDPVPVLAAGANYTSTVGPFGCPCDQTLNIKVCADNGEVVAESDETNNCMENELVCTPCVPPEYTIKIDEYTLALYDGGEVTVPVEILNATDVEGGEANVTFDASVVGVKAVSAGNFGTPEAYIDNTNGFVHIAATSATAAGEDEAVLAYVVFEGIAEGETALVIDDAYVSFDAGATSIPAATEDGYITVETWMRGDLNHNDRLDTGDATLVLRMVVGLTPTDMLGDMNNNGRIDTGDATIILRIIVGLPVL